MSNQLSSSASDPTAATDHPVEGLAVTSAALDASQGQGARDAKKRKKQRARVRGAWIAFVGRIVAQFVGSAATIVLGLALIERHAALTGAQAAPVAAAATPAPAPRVPAGSKVLVVPLQVSASQQQALVEQLAAAIKESLGENVSIAIVSNTPVAPLPLHERATKAVARDRTADVVLEGSIARQSAVR